MTGRYIYDLPIRKSSTHLWDLKEHTMNILDANNFNWFRVKVSWEVRKVRKIVSVLVRSSTCKWVGFFWPVYLLIIVSFIFSLVTDMYFTENVKNGLIWILTLAAEFFSYYHKKLQRFTFRWPQMRAANNLKKVKRRFLKQ